LQTRRYL